MTGETGTTGKLRHIIVLECLLALAVAGVGIWYVLSVEETDAWAGLGLIGLATIIYFMRGQVISKLTLSSSGVVAELNRKADDAVATADRAMQAANSVMDQAQRALAAAEAARRKVAEDADLAADKARQAAAALEAAQRDAALLRETVTRQAGEALAAAEAARKDASLAREVATQHQAAPARPEPLADGAAKHEEDGERWSHPELAALRKPAPADDPQKHQWGGLEVRNGRKLDAEVEEVDRDWFRVTMRVSSTDGLKPLANRVRFHLHDTFRRSVVMVKPANGVAELVRVAYGAFTVGAEVENEPGTFLELDLASDLVDAPARFKGR